MNIKDRIAYREAEMRKRIEGELQEQFKDEPQAYEQPEPPNIRQIAKTCHEVNKAYCETMKDFSQPSWEDAPDWQKDSAMNGVRYHLDNPDAGPSGSHENWLKEKEENGWVYGKEKDPEKKEHPCMVPYEKLPKKQQYKDALFISVIKSFL